MKSLLSALVAGTTIVAGLVASPGATIAQTPPADTTPTPAPAQPGFPSDEEDASPDDPVADDLTVRRGRDDERDSSGQFHGSSRGNNIVLVRNRADNKMRMRSRIRLVEIHGDRAEPLNGAFAYASCTGCQTFAVALEIALVSPHASIIAPQNRAHALNYECTDCVTVARALQYVLVLDDPSQVPDNVERLLREMERELRAISGERDISPQQANDRIDAVILQFTELAEHLTDQRDATEERTSPGAMPPADPTPTATPSPSPAALTRFFPGRF
jgi:hypothetical protein